MEDKDVLEFQEEEEEEALSLSDLPLTTDDNDELLNSCDSSKRRSSSEPAEFFEFFNDLTNSDMCPADDIIFCGKLVPFKNQSTKTTTTSQTLSTDDPNPKYNVVRRRSDSLPELRTFPSNTTTKTTHSLMRNSRSLDYRKLHRSSSSDDSPPPGFYRNSSCKGSGKSDISGRKVPFSGSHQKSRWYLFIFGSIKFPPEMELRDIKNRQVRRNPSTLFPAVTTGGKVPVNRTGGKGSWGFLRTLSCKDSASVAVTASFTCIPRV